MNNTWSNAALVAYSLLPKIVRDIDNKVNSRVKSSFMSKHLSIGVSTKKLIEETVALIDEKRKIVNLRFIVDKGIESLGGKNRSALELRYVKRLSFKEIAQEENITERTAFRRVTAAEKAFADALNELGYSEKWLKNEYSDDMFISNVYNRIKNENHIVVKIQ